MQEAVKAHEQGDEMEENKSMLFREGDKDRAAGRGERGHSKQRGSKCSQARDLQELDGQLQETIRTLDEDGIVRRREDKQGLVLLETCFWISSEV